MKRWSKPFLIFQTFFIITLAVVIYSRSKEQAPLPIINSIPLFSLTSSEGVDFSSESLRNKVWVADFIFTSCPGQCLLMSKTMQNVYRSYQREGDFRVVSISTDPETDTPKKLAKYAERFDASPKNWHFLTGDKKIIQKLSVESFKLSMPDDPMLHSSRFVLIDRGYQIRGYYDSTDSKEIQRLVRDIATLLRSPQT